MLAFSALSSADLDTIPGIPRIRTSFLQGLFATISFLYLFLIFFIFPYEHIVITNLNLFLRLLIFSGNLLLVVRNIVSLNFWITVPAVALQNAFALYLVWVKALDNVDVHTRRNVVVFIPPILFVYHNGAWIAFSDHIQVRYTSSSAVRRNYPLLVLNSWLVFVVRWGVYGLFLFVPLILIKRCIVWSYGWQGLNSHLVILVLDQLGLRLNFGQVRIRFLVRV